MNQAKNRAQIKSVRHLRKENNTDSIIADGQRFVVMLNAQQDMRSKHLDIIFLKNVQPETNLCVYKGETLREKRRTSIMEDNQIIKLYF